MKNIEEGIPIIWKKPHKSTDLLHIHDLSILLDQFIKRYRKRLEIRSIMIDLETPQNATGISDHMFIIKLHLELKSGRLLMAESKRRSIRDAMKNITSEMDNQSRSTDRQKHPDSSREQGSV
jgi:hypothetical protein